MLRSFNELLTIIIFIDLIVTQMIAQMDDSIEKQSFDTPDSKAFS